VDVFTDGFLSLYNTVVSTMAFALCGGFNGNVPGGAACAAAASASLTKAEGGTWSQALKAGAITAASAYAFGTWGKPDAAGLIGLKEFVINGTIGGITNLLSGENFGNGFLSAGVGAWLGAKAGANWGAAGRIAASAAIGGVVSELSGGKFANGAVTAAAAASVGEAAANEGIPSAAQGTKERQRSYTLDVSIVNDGGHSSPQEAALAGYRATDGMYVNTGQKMEVVFVIAKNLNTNMYFYTTAVRVSSNNKVRFRIHGDDEYKYAGHAHTHPYDGRNQEGFSAGDNINNAAIYPRFLRSPSGNAYIQTGFVPMVPGADVPLSQTPSICPGGTPCLTPHAGYDK